MSTTPTLRLYRVTLRGFGGFTTSADYKDSYVVAPDPTTAYQMVRRALETHCEGGYGFASDRELQKVELLAEASHYTDTKTRLFLPEPEVAMVHAMQQVLHDPTKGMGGPTA